MKRPFRTASQPPASVTLVSAREVTDPWAPTPYARFDIRLSSAGMTVGPSAGSRAVVPVVVPWSLLLGFSANQWVTTADGATGQILEIVVCAPDRRDGSQIRRFLVPAPDLVHFFKGVGAWSKQWATALRSVGSPGAPSSKLAATGARPRGVVLSAYLATAAWLGSQVLPGIGHRGAGSAERASDQQRVGKAVIGLVAVVLAAGVATASFAITASGGSPPHRSAQSAAHRAPVALGNVLQASDAPKIAATSRRVIGPGPGAAVT